MNFSLSKLWEIVKDREASHAAVQEIIELDTSEQLNNRMAGVMGNRVPFN